MNYNQYYNEINTQELISSPQWSETFSYSETFDHYPTEEELLDLDVYVEENALMKNFVMSIDGNPCSVKFRMTVEPIYGTSDYKVYPRGVSIDIGFSDFINNALLAYGYRGNNYTKEDISALMVEDYEGPDIDLERKLINGIIDIYGQSSYDYNLMDIVYNYLEAFPDIDNPCVINQRPLPDGESFISIYDHSDFINNIVAYNNDSAITSTYTPLQLKDALDKLYSDDTYFKNILSNSQVVRICFWQISPNITRMYVNGYTLSNASIVTTTESSNNQHYAGVVTHIKGARYAVSPNDFGDRYFHREYDPWDYDTSYSTADVFYNYYRRDWFSANGLGHEALTGVGPIIDSLGNIASMTPITPISTLHTKWYEPDVDDVYKPLGHEPIDPTVPDIEVQPLIRRGIPPVIIKPRPIIGLLPNPVIDPVSPPTFDDDVGLTLYGGNIFHPYFGTVSKFFDWLWDRDTWHDKQEMNSDPMEAIISLHTLPLPNEVPYDEAGNSSYWYSANHENDKVIMLGYLAAQDMSTDPSSDLTAPIVINRICHFCFGHVNIPRTYLDYRDFEREIYIYLPYVGFKQIRCDDITPYLNPYVVEYFAELYLDYFIDVATGDFEAIISINKNVSDRKVLYTFNGNMAVSVPLTGTDKTRLEQARWNTLMSVGQTALSMGGTILGGMMGNPMFAVGSFASGIHGAMNVANNLNTLKNQNVVSVERNGTLASSFGAMSPKTPYVVINSPIGYDTVYGPYCGDSANVTTQLGVLTGFVKCKYVHVDTLASATLSEKDEIERALLNGVIF